MLRDKPGRLRMLSNHDLQKNWSQLCTWLFKAKPLLRGFHADCGRWKSFRASVLMALNEELVRHKANNSTGRFRRGLENIPAFIVYMKDPYEIIMSRVAERSKTTILTNRAVISIGADCERLCQGVSGQMRL